jgi:cytochrome oxidase Cu insertion factor (SCO1/SenC/PrrC family)
MHGKRFTGVVLPALVCLVLGALGGVGTALVTKRQPTTEPVRFVVPRQPLPHFRLRDQDGRWTTPADARGNVLVVTFLYSRCRDLCPHQAAEIKDAVLAAGGGVEVYGITVDPEHDTPERARAWLKRMGVAGGPVRFLLGERRQLTPVWQEFGIVPLMPEEEDAEADEHYGADAPTEPPAQRPPPAAANDPYPAADDGVYRGRPRHRAGPDYEHSAYVLVIDKHGRERVGFSFELLTSALLLRDMKVLKAEA